MSWLLASVSFWVLIALATWIGLQLFPFPGIFLMMFGGVFITGFIVHALLVSLALESLTGRIPMAFLTVPILAWGGYYVMYAIEGVQIAAKEAELKARNPGLVLQYDPRLHSLVMKDANTFVASHRIPVAYSMPDPKAGEYFAHRIVTRQQCDAIPQDSRNRIWKHGFSHEGYSPRHICSLRLPETPTSSKLEVTIDGDLQTWKREGQIRQQTTVLHRNGARIGAFEEASIWRLQAFPWPYGGGWLNSARPAWEYAFGFMRRYVHLDTVPAGIDSSRYRHPLAVMLGIEKNTAQFLESFRGYEINAAVVEGAKGVAQGVTDDVFAHLERMLADPTVRPIIGMAYPLSQDPGRLARYAGPMIDRFEGWLKQSRLPDTDFTRNFARAIASLRHEDFKPQAKRIFDLLSSSRRWASEFPTLWLRAADVGPSALPFYREAFDTYKGSPRIVAVLAICRIGEADRELIEKMKSLVKSLTFKDHDDNRLHEALFLTLLKLGEREFVTANKGDPRYKDTSWQDAILAGQADTPMGPNNCMIRQWIYDESVPQVMAPVLRR